MKKSEYPIAVIDEQIEQLNDLEQAFERAGRHCMKIQYNANYSGEPYTDIELLFLDINLTPGPGRSDNAVFATLENAINTYIAEENGPYVLVFWTSLPYLVEDFKAFISRDTNSSVNKHRPILVETLAKEDFQVDPEATILNILNNPIVKLVFYLHDCLRVASSNAFKELMGCVPKTENWGGNSEYLEAFKKVFTRIAVSSVGKQNAISIPDKAIFEVVGREVLHQLVKNSTDAWKVVLDLDAAKVKEAENVLYEDWQYKLNTVFHVEPEIISNVDRGAVLTGKKWVFDSLLGRDMNEWIQEEFQIPQNTNDDSQIIPVAVEISPACDYAQSTPRLYKYALGVCRISKQRPSNSMENGKTPPFKKRNSHGVMPTFFLGGLFYKMVVSYNYVAGLRESTANDLHHIMTLRNEMVNMLSSSASDNASRIGFLNINEV